MIMLANRQTSIYFFSDKKFDDLQGDFGDEFLDQDLNLLTYSNESAKKLRGDEQMNLLTLPLRDGPLDNLLYFSSCVFLLTFLFLFFFGLMMIFLVFVSHA